MTVSASTIKVLFGRMVEINRIVFGILNPLILMVGQSEYSNV